MADKHTEWLTINETSEFLGCSPLTLRRIISRGELRAYRSRGKSRIIRIKRADLDRFMRPVTSAAENLGGDAA